MTDREKKLALAVFALVPIGLVFGVIMLLGGSYQSKTNTYNNLVKSRTELQQKMLAGLRAENRRGIYVAESLPSDRNISTAQYRDWLTKLAKKEIGFESVVVRKLRAESVAINMQELIYRRLPFSLKCDGTTRQLTEFLYKFHQTKIFHRITKLDIKPVTNIVNGKSVSTDKLKFDLSIDVACIPEAAESREFETQQRKRLPKSLQEYHDIFSHRDIFGPPNNAPKFEKLTSKDAQATTDRAGSFIIRIDDADEDDELTLELVETSQPDVKLVHTDPKARTARFTYPGLERGSHQFIAKVTDNGCPPKSDDLRINLTVSDPEPAAAPAEPEKVSYAKQTFIKGSIESDGVAQLWIEFRVPSGEFKRFDIGDSFEVDNKTWKIIKIGDNKFTIECDGNHLIFQSGDNLAKPTGQSTPAAAAATSGDDSEPPATGK